MSKRINWIDWAKVITITLVVLGHMTFAPSNQIVHTFIYSFHMPLFFLISGYLSKPEENIQFLLRKNFKTLIIPYVCLNIIAFFIFFLPINGWNSVAIKQTLLSFIRGTGYSPAAPCWFLLSLFICKILSFYILKFRNTLQIITLLALPIVAVLLVKIFHFDMLLKLPSALIGVTFYIVGYYMKLNGVINKITQTSYILIILGVTLILQLCYIDIQGFVGIYSVSLGKYPPLYFIMSLNGSIMIIMLCKLFDNFELKFIKTLSLSTIIVLAFWTS